MKKHLSNKIITFTFCILIASAVTSFGQTNAPQSIYDLSIGELAKLKIVTATKSEQEADKILATVRIIEKKEIQENGYFTLDELLSDISGFQFRNIMSLNSYIFQRGIPNQNNLALILVDGLQINELNSGGFYGGGQFNLANIERIEIVYGPSSVAYGTNAITGVINIITSNANQNGGHIRALGGSFSTYLSDASLNWYNKEKKAGISLSGMLKESEKADLKGAAGDNNWSDLMDNFEKDYSLSLKINYKDFTLGTNYLQKQTSLATLFPSVGTIYNDYGTLWNILFVNNYLRFTKNISSKLKLTTTLYNRNTSVLKNTIYYVLDTAQVSYYRPNNLTGAEGVASYKYNKHLSVTSGLLFEYENLAKGPSQTYSQSMEEKPPTPAKPSMQKNYLASLFIEPDLMLFKSLYVSGGIRFDMSTIYDKVLTPRVGLRYNVNQHSVRLNYAEGFRAPKPWDYTDGMGNPNLNPERMKAVELSLFLSICQELHLETNIYRNRLLNGFFKETVENSYRWINKDEIVTYGGELNLAYENKRVKASLNYTYTDSRDKEKKPIPEISKHVANMSLNYKFSKEINANIRANFIGDRENPHLITATNNSTISHYLLLNGAINWCPNKQLTLQLIGKNLMNSEYYHTSNRTVDRYRQPQRTILLAISYYFE